MFRHTGEPPTPPLEGLVDSQRLVVDDLPSSRNTSDSGKDSRSQSLTGQEQDSGYEASPCSADNSSFFKEHVPAVVGDDHQDHEDPEEEKELFWEFYDPSSSPDDVFEDAILLETEEDELSSENRIMVRDFPYPTVARRSDFQRSGRTTDCDSEGSSSSSSVQRPASFPIDIPSRNWYHVDSGNRTVGCRNCSQHELSHLRDYRFHSWPSTHGVTCWCQSLKTFVSSELNRSIVDAADPQSSTEQSVDHQDNQQYRPQFGRMSPLRERSRTWNDEESSIRISPCPAQSRPDGTNPMLDDEGARASPLEPLPDLVLHSSPSLVRRNRSNSVNLPLSDDAIRAVGRRLRRLSHDFEMNRASRNCLVRTPGLAEITKFFRSS